MDIDNSSNEKGCDLPSPIKDLNRVRYWRSIRDLPDTWIHPDTHVMVWGDDDVYAHNKNFTPMRYRDGQWCEIEYKPISSSV